MFRVLLGCITLNYASILRPKIVGNCQNLSQNGRFYLTWDVRAVWWSCTLQLCINIEATDIWLEVESGIRAWKKCILLPKLLWPNVWKNCSSDGEKLLKFEVEGREFENFLRSLEQFIQTVKGQKHFLNVVVLLSKTGKQYVFTFFQALCNW